MDLTAVIACKDRDRNLKFCLSYISACKPRPKTIVVNYNGSSSLEFIEERFPWVQLIQVTNEDTLFHKSLALNIGIRATETTHCCLTDADQVFNVNFFEVVLNERLKGKIFVMCDTFFLETLPATFDPYSFSFETYKNLFHLARNSSLVPLGAGCCNAVDTKWLKEVHGLNEQYRGWGFEDKDLDIRAKRSGYTFVNIRKQTSMVHLPHTRDVEYFNKTLRERNEGLYRLAESGVSPIVANPDGWGEP